MSGSIQGAHGVAASPDVAPLAQTILSVADKAFASGMADAMLIASIIMVAASVFTFLVLPSEIRCMEDDCVEEEEKIDVGVPEMVPAAGD